MSDAVLLIALELSLLLLPVDRGEGESRLLFVLIKGIKKVKIVRWCHAQGM